MLRLASATRSDWLPEALENIDAILLDHAHCEKKAASTAVGMLFRYADRHALMTPLSELAREELRHFEQVLRVIESRGNRFERMLPSTYAGRLCAAIRRTEPERMLDHLLCGALIEARSCERMQLLAEALEEPALRRLYSGLLASEARHHQMYVDLAAQYAGLSTAIERLEELSQHEAEVLSKPAGPIRMHS